mmetsp:Transcript_109337/g.172305  ORF Transcript_109337/g.172305 Transcript_109337/m.172305 type:complete len:394 (+) Transcript_109337:42-1223(+)|eukprot:CAMPEP_0169114400 /NCGR_PEP_ID=MMETSP1015-20121227/28730_1 /TAXON_ID=342587 /ORGANISM="Karlodinium micrum, Strain CCMP2283" /LENGTH=393 /DNA_ID=CAMNT_0009176665 /DNA_START=42 /DNA_END=1223 /DNA_ORIENTATION=-
MFAFPCDAEVAASKPAAMRCRPGPLGLGESESDSGSSESTAVPINSGLEAWSLPCTPISRNLQTPLDRPAASPPPSPAPVAPPGLPLPDQFPSHGSLLHDVGQCRPCAWFWKAPGCQNGRDCCHCHLCPPGELKARKKAKIIAAKADAGKGDTRAIDALVDSARQQTYMLATVPVQPPSLELLTLLPKVEPPPPPSVPCFPMHLSPSMLPQLKAHPPAPPVESPKLKLKGDVDFSSPPPLKEPQVDLSPGALPRTLALACMDEDASRSVIKPASGHAVASDVKVEDDSESRQSPRLQCHLAFPRHRVTLDLDRALLPSKGSDLHAVGQCVACAWFWKPQGCQNDRECSYCHLCPQGEIRRRRKMKNAVLRSRTSDISEVAIPKPSFQILPLLR